MNIDLLEYVAAKASCGLISDLKGRLGIMEKRAILHCIRGIAPETCPIWEWEDAVTYLCGDEIFFRNQADAKEFILARLERSLKGQ